MNIISLRPAPCGSGNTIAHVDIEIIDGARLYGLRIAQMSDRSFRVFGPNTDRGGRSMSFDPAVVNAIARAALNHSQLDEHSQYDRVTS